MKVSEIKKILIKHLILDKIYVSGKKCNFNITVISKQFIGMNKVKRQQMIYHPLMEYIANKQIHSLSIKVYTPDEWLQDHKLTYL